MSLTLPTENATITDDRPVIDGEKVETGSYEQMVREPLAYFSSGLVPLPQLVAVVQVLAASGLVDWQADRWEVVELGAKLLERAALAQQESQVVRQASRGN
jgi:hypothetical protein